jgi:NADH:ubiquinone oxidoreductase subunit K
MHVDHSLFNLCNSVSGGVGISVRRKKVLILLPREHLTLALALQLKTLRKFLEPFLKRVMNVYKLLVVALF